MNLIIENKEAILNTFQVILNVSAISIAGFILKNYISTLKEKNEIKDEKIKLLETTLKITNDKLSSLEKRTPEYIEEILSKRIKLREDEIKRLNDDYSNNKNEINKKNDEIVILKKDLKKARSLSQKTKIVFNDFDDYFFSSEGEIEIVELGGIVVESGTLMITDPCWIDEGWLFEKLQDIRIYRDIETDFVYQYLKDFDNYQCKISGFDKTVNELIKSKRFEELDINRHKSFSYNGVGSAVGSNDRFGVLELEDETEVAVAVSTVWGDKTYTVYGEKYEGRIIRIFVSLL